MNLEERIRSFSVLGEILRNALNGGSGSYSEQINTLIYNQQNVNPWFTPENVRNALKAIANELTGEKLISWTNAYPGLKEMTVPVKAGIIMAGNIPLAGFHDFLCVLICGNHVIVKTSSKDYQLIQGISDILCSVNPGFRGRIEFAEGLLAGFDVVIATGSNNSSRYFEYYFGRYPNIIRKNRNSIAIIEGNETGQEFRELGKDIFSYFGLGCRNVSKIYLPAGFELTAFKSHWDEFASLVRHTKYANNYDFNKAVYIVNKENFYDTGYLLLKEDKGLSSPVSVLYYEYYDSYSSLKYELEGLSEKIQCIVGRQHILFGKAQSPELWNYADGIDTIEFLLKKK